MTCHPRLSFAPLRPNPAQRVFSEQQAAALGHGDLLKTGKRREGCLDLLEAVSTGGCGRRGTTSSATSTRGGGHGVSTDGATVFSSMRAAAPCCRRGEASAPTSRSCSMWRHAVGRALSF